MGLDATRENRLLNFFMEDAESKVRIRTGLKGFRA